MPWMAEHQTTSNLRRLAGRKTSLPGGPHLPAGSGDKPPVLFRLPEVTVSSGAVANAPVASSNSPGHTSPAHTVPAPHIVSSVSQDLANTNYNAINHVAGAVTGTVASGLAAAGSISKNAITAGAASVGSLASEFAPLKNYSSAAGSLSTNIDSSLLSKTERATANKPLPDSVDAESRSWWEHWSSGIILMLLILALVTAGIIAIRDPERSRNTDRSIADQIKDVKMPDRVEKGESGITPPSLITSDKPTLADTKSQTNSTSTSTLLPESMLPKAVDGSSDPLQKDSNRKPITSVDASSLAKPAVAADLPTAQASLGSPQPKLASNSKTFVSSSVASQSGPASAGSANPLASGIAGQGSPSVPTMTASTPLKNSTNNSAPENSSSPSEKENQQGPNLTWPVQEEDNTNIEGEMETSRSSKKEQTQFVLNSPQPQIPDTAITAATTSPALPAAATSTAAATTTATASTTNAATTNASINNSSNVVSATPGAATDVTQKSVTRPAVLETSLPDEDLENILARRRQALAQARVTTNQFYPGNMQTVSGAPSLPQPQTQSAATLPYGNNPANAFPPGTQPGSNTSMPTYSIPNAAPAPNAATSGQPINTYPSNQPVNNGGYPAATNRDSTFGNAVANPANTAAPVNTAAPGNSAQPAATRSWTYQPNQTPQTNSWTLPTSSNTAQPANPNSVPNAGVAGPNNYYQPAPTNPPSFNNTSFNNINAGSMVNGSNPYNQIPQSNPAAFQQPNYAPPGYQTGNPANAGRYQVVNPYTVAPATNGQPTVNQPAQGFTNPVQPTARQTLSSLLGPSPNIVAPQNRIPNGSLPNQAIPNAAGGTMPQGQGYFPTNQVNPNVAYPNNVNSNQFPSNYAPPSSGSSNYPLPNQGRP